MNSNLKAIPTEVSRAFIEDMQKFHATDPNNKLARDKIAARQMHIMNEYVNGKPLRVSDIVLLFNTF